MITHNDNSLVDPVKVLQLACANECKSESSIPFSPHRHCVAETSRFRMSDRDKVASLVTSRRDPFTLSASVPRIHDNRSDFDGLGFRPFPKEFFLNGNPVHGGRRREVTCQVAPRDQYTGFESLICDIFTPTGRGVLRHSLIGKRFLVPLVPGHCQEDVDSSRVSGFSEILTLQGHVLAEYPR